jgi:hypothetical protein
VSSANNIGFARKFIRNERSFIYTKNSRGPNDFDRFNRDK